MLISTNSFLAQSDLRIENTKTVNTPTNSIPTDSRAKNLQTPPLVIKDSTQTVTVDTLDTEDSEPLEHPIEYNARDSIRYETKGQKIFLFGDGRVKYDGMDMKAEFIEIDNEKNTLTAFGKTDSLGKETGTPVFNDGSQEVMARKIVYNLKTKKGKIYDIKT
ncbi:MAG: hypothetical protein IT237_07830, partial [Bacteroidia bacterium]|nr:hypothetical protein [Bacteroidia bacterium]